MSRHLPRRTAPKKIIQVAGIALMTLASLAAARADTLDTNSYNFQLSGGGGGASATLNGTTNLEIFCVDFNNNIQVPQSGYNAYLTSFSSTDFTHTRFGAVTSWQQDTNNSVIDNIQGSVVGTTGVSSAQIRYELAAYLISQYDLPSQSDAYNNGIQTAVWEMLDPVNLTVSALYPQAPYTSDPTAALAAAASWYSQTSEQGRENYLSDYRILSDMQMISPGGNLPQSSGFQEMITRVPEPGLFSLLACSLLGLLWQGRRAGRVQLGGARIE